MHIIGRLLLLAGVAWWVISPLAMAWNALGHQVIAAIAYEQLSHSSKQRINTILASRFHQHSASWRLLAASTWPDRLRGERYQALQGWHYINRPLTPYLSTCPVSQDNIITAFSALEQQWGHKATAAQRAWQLAWIIHLVGDAAQPLHCATQVSAQWPCGDAGGNWVKLDHPLAGNLHQFWDRGAGWLVRGQQPLGVWQLAKRCLQQSLSAAQIQQLKHQRIQAWVQASHQLAKRWVYSLPAQGITDHYQQMCQQLTRQQLCLAGERLTYWLATHGYSLTPTAARRLQLTTNS